MKVIHKTYNGYEKITCGDITINDVITFGDPTTVEKPFWDEILEICYVANNTHNLEVTKLNLRSYRHFYKNLPIHLPVWKKFKNKY
jgi:hypothetical protein